MPRRNLKQLYVSEFSGYNLHKLQQDAMAGLTVAAVALPLALAFGVVSGATASAGLVTAVIAGFVIGDTFWGTISNQRTNRRNECGFDCAVHKNTA